MTFISHMRLETLAVSVLSLAQLLFYVISLKGREKYFDFAPSVLYNYYVIVKLFQSKIYRSIGIFFFFGVIKNKIKKN